MKKKAEVPEYEQIASIANSDNHEKTKQIADLLESATSTRLDAQSALNQQDKDKAEGEEEIISAILEKALDDNPGTQQQIFDAIYELSLANKDARRAKTLSNFLKKKILLKKQQDAIPEFEKVLFYLEAVSHCYEQNIDIVDTLRELVVFLIKENFLDLAAKTIRVLSNTGKDNKEIHAKKIKAIKSLVPDLMAIISSSENKDLIFNAAFSMRDLENSKNFEKAVLMILKKEYKLDDEMQSLIFRKKIFNLLRMHSKGGSVAKNILGKALGKDIKIVFKAYEMAALKSACGFLQSMSELDNDSVLIEYSSEVDEETATKEMPTGYQARNRGEAKNKNEIFITFTGIHGISQAYQDSMSHLDISYGDYPLKYKGNSLVTQEELDKLGKEIDIKDREVVVLGSINFEDAKKIIEEVEISNSDGLGKPIFILAPRNYLKPDEINEIESQNQYKTRVRTSENKEKRESFPSLTDVDIFILNTTGELNLMYALASKQGLCILGEDRNLSEPIDQNCPTLIMGKKWLENKSIKRALEKGGGILEFSKVTLLDLLKNQSMREDLTKRASDANREFKNKNLPKSERNLTYALILSSLAHRHKKRLAFS